jgi:hypothetical protein
MQLEPPLGTPDYAVATPGVGVDQDRIYGDGFVFEQVVNFLIGEPGPGAEGCVWGSGVMMDRELGFVELLVEGMFGIVDQILGAFPFIFQIAEPTGAIAPFATVRTIVNVMAGPGWKRARTTNRCALDEPGGVTHCGCSPLHRALTVENYKIED